MDSLAGFSLKKKTAGSGLSRRGWSCAASLAAAFALAPPAAAERLENQVAVFSALDKVTARISTFQVEIGKTEVFGALKVTPRACYSRPATEEPKTTTFVEVDEVQLDGTEKRIFTGWMFAESPGIFGVEHPTFDVWLKHCDKPLSAAAQNGAGIGSAPPAEAGQAEGAAAPPPPPPDLPRRRVRR